MRAKRQTQFVVGRWGLSCALLMAAAAGVAGQPLAKVDPNREDVQPVKDRYAVVTSLTRDDPYWRVGEALAKHRRVEMVQVPTGPPESLIAALRQLRAEQVALVARPEDLTANLVSTVFLASVTMDHDPELEFGYGFITGATADDAMALVRGTIEAETTPPSLQRAVCLGHVFGGQGHCYRAMLDRAQEYVRLGFLAGAVRFDDDDKQWDDRKAGELAKLDGATALVFCGHGDGETSCGVRGAELARAKLNHAVVFNGTCFANALVERWAIGEDRTLRRENLKAETSVALGLIRAGARGIFGSTVTSGYVNVLPAMLSVERGASLGEAFRGSQNANIRRAQLTDLNVCPYREGEESPQFRGTEKERSTHSISPVALIGDPAYVPYPGGLPGAKEAETQPLPAVNTEEPKQLELTAGRHEFILGRSHGLSTMVISYLPDRSFSYLSRMAVSDNQGVRALLRFDCSGASLAEGVRLRSATLHLHRNKATSVGDTGAEDHRVGLRRILEPWGAETTWSNMPRFEEAPFATLPYEKKTGWLEIDITSQFEEWLAQSDTNNGILLKFSVEDRKGWVSWDLAGASAPDETQRPKIVVECE